jgi:hypothetical protein
MPVEQQITAAMVQLAVDYKRLNKTDFTNARSDAPILGRAFHALGYLLGRADLGQSALDSERRLVYAVATTLGIRTSIIMRVVE